MSSVANASGKSASRRFGTGLASARATSRSRAVALVVVKAVVACCWVRVRPVRIAPTFAVRIGPGVAQAARQRTARAIAMRAIEDRTGILAPHQAGSRASHGDVNPSNRSNPAYRKGRRAHGVANLGSRD